MIIPATILGVLVAVFYTHMAFQGLYSFLGTKKDLKKVAKWRWAVFIIPLFFLAAGLLGIGIWDNPISIGVNIITISVIVTIVIEILRWRFKKNGMDITVEQRFRAEWPDIEVLDPEKLDLDPLEENFLRRVCESPQKYSMAVFRCFGLTLETVVLTYLDFLESTGHATVDKWVGESEFRRIEKELARLDKPTHFLLTTTSYEIASLHQISYERKLGLIFIMSDIKEIKISLSD